MSEFNFSCPVCGQNIVCDTAIESTQHICPHCNNTIGVPKGFAEHAEVPPQTDTPPALTGHNATAAAPRTSRLAIASLVCSLASLVTCIGWIPGIICGHLAKSRIRRDSSLKGNGLATAGLTIGYLVFDAGSGNRRISYLVFFQRRETGNCKCPAGPGYKQYHRHPDAIHHCIQRQPTDGTRQARGRCQPAAANGPAASGWTSDVSKVRFRTIRSAGNCMAWISHSRRQRSGAPTSESILKTGCRWTSWVWMNPLKARVMKSNRLTRSANPRVRMTWNEGDVIHDRDL